MTRYLKAALKAVGDFLRRIGFFLGHINSYVLLTVSFYLILTPISLARRIFVRRRDSRGWIRREPLPPDHFRKQY